MNTQHELIEQSMQAQRSYLDIVRSHHHQWAYSSEDPEIQRRHLEIAALIQQTLDQYYELLNTYASVTAAPIRSDILHFIQFPSQLPKTPELPRLIYSVLFIKEKYVWRTSMFTHAVSSQP